jgi:hypothetical protein
LLDNVPSGAGLQKRASFSSQIAGLAGTGNRTQVTCVTGSFTNRSAIHYVIQTSSAQQAEFSCPADMSDMQTFFDNFLVDSQEASNKYRIATVYNVPTILLFPDGIWYPNSWLPSWYFSWSYLGSLTQLQHDSPKNIPDPDSSCFVSFVNVSLI